jgi:hypothetical protein
MKKKENANILLLGFIPRMNLMSRKEIKMKIELCHSITTSFKYFLKFVLTIIERIRVN